MSKKTDLRIQNQDKTLNVDVRLFVPQVRQFKNSLVVFLPDVFGLENKTTNLFMEKLSETLKVDVILLDLFRGDPWNKGTPIGADYSKFPGWLQSHPFEEQVYPDISLVCQHFKEKSKDLKICIVGTCMGGNYCYQVLCKSKSPVDFGVPLYPSRFDFEKSKDLSFPMLTIFAEKDTIIPLENITKLDNLLKQKENCPEYKIEIYKDVGHAFLHNPQNSQDEKEASQAFKLVVEWIEKHF